MALSCCHGEVNLEKNWHLRTIQIHTVEKCAIRFPAYCFSETSSHFVLKGNGNCFWKSGSGHPYLQYVS